MSRALIILCVATSLNGFGCGRGEIREGDQVIPTSRLDRGQSPTDNPNRVFGLEGELLESNLRIAGLVLPRGLQEKFTQGRLHSYETSIALDKLQRYFGPRLLTGRVERIGEGAIYRMASVRGTPENAQRIDVALLPLATGRVSVAITELALVPEHPPTEDRIRDALHAQEEQAR